MNLALLNPFERSKVRCFGAVLQGERRGRHLLGEILGNYECTIILGAHSPSDGCIDAGECLLKLDFYARHCSLLQSPFYNCRPRIARYPTYKIASFLTNLNSIKHV